MGSIICIPKGERHTRRICAARHNAVPHMYNICTCIHSNYVYTPVHVHAIYVYTRCTMHHRSAQYPTPRCRIRAARNTHRSALRYAYPHINLNSTFYLGQIHVMYAQLVIVAPIYPIPYTHDAQLVIVAVSFCSDFSIRRVRAAFKTEVSAYLKLHI